MSCLVHRLARSPARPGVLPIMAVRSWGFADPLRFEKLPEWILQIDNAGSGFLSVWLIFSRIRLLPPIVGIIRLIEDREA